MEIVTVAAGLAVFVGAVAQALSGLGFVLVCGPALVLLLGLSEGVRVAVVLGLVLNAVLLVRERHGVNARIAGMLLLGAVGTTPAWGWLVHRLPVETLARAAGAATLAGVVALAVGWRLPAARGFAGALVAGAASSAMNVLAGVGGPAIALYARNADWSAAEIRPTVQAYGVVLNVATLLAIGSPHVSVELAVGLLGALIAGLATGAVTAHLVSDRHAQRLILALAAVGGLVLVIRGGV